MMSFKLNKIELKGYKSISGSGQTIPINDDVTVLIGPNGVGKSNMMSFFQLLNYAMKGGLQNYIGGNGFADAFLYYGSKNTDCIKAHLYFSDDNSSNEYSFRLAYAANDTLIYTEEKLSFHNKGQKRPFIVTLESGNKESQLFTVREGKYKNTIKVFVNLLKQCRYFQFHDTTKDASIRKFSFIGDNKYLKDNAGNLAAFLYGLKNQEGGLPYYERIVRYIRQVMPQFDDFVMQPSLLNPDFISLDWKERANDNIFSVNQISDGTLRFMALASLLLQPPTNLPSVIIIDEPELGLHPLAISILASMIRTASQYAQIVIATQSPRLLDEFSAEKIVVIDRDEAGHTSVFHQLNREQLKEWADEYTMSELWEKNVLGGRP